MRVAGSVRVISRSQQGQGKGNQFFGHFLSLLIKMIRRISGRGDQEKKRPSPRYANKTCEDGFRKFNSISFLRGLFIHGVNKSPGFASSYLHTFPHSQWLPNRAFVRFTVTGIARNSHPCSYDAVFTKSFSVKRAAHRCADTPAIHLSGSL